MELKLLRCDSKETFHIVLNCEYWNNCFYLKQNAVPTECGDSIF